MESLYFLVPCALIFIGLAIKVLFWAIHNGQYDNLDTEAHRILFDAEAKQKSEHQESALPVTGSPAAGSPAAGSPAAGSPGETPTKQDAQ